MPTIDLSEPRWAIAVSGRARGDRDYMVSCTLMLRTTPTPDPQPRSVRFRSCQLCLFRFAVRESETVMSLHSVSLGRTTLVSSTSSELLLRSSVPRSAAPFLVACPFAQDGPDTAARSGAPPAVAAEMKAVFRRRLQFRFSPRVATGLDRRTTRAACSSYSALLCVTTARPL